MHGGGMIGAAVSLLAVAAFALGFALVIGGSLATAAWRPHTVDGSIPRSATAVTVAGGVVMLVAAAAWVLLLALST